MSMEEVSETNEVSDSEVEIDSAPVPEVKESSSPMLHPLKALKTKTISNTLISILLAAIVIILLALYSLYGTQRTFDAELSKKLAQNIVAITSAILITASVATYTSKFMPDSFHGRVVNGTMIGFMKDLIETIINNGFNINNLKLDKLLQAKVINEVFVNILRYLKIDTLFNDENKILRNIIFTLLTDICVGFLITGTFELTTEMKIRGIVLYTLLTYFKHDNRFKVENVGLNKF